jgi:hypothetical protein
VDVLSALGNTRMLRAGDSAGSSNHAAPPGCQRCTLLRLDKYDPADQWLLTSEPSLLLAEPSWYSHTRSSLTSAS